MKTHLNISLLIFSIFLLFCITSTASAFTLNNSWSSDHNWYKGEIHSHTVNSDGEDTPEDLVTYYRDHGYDFICITDHTFYTAPPDIPGILEIGGVEETVRSQPTNDPSVKNHLGAIGTNEAYYSMVYAQKVIDKINAVGGISILNHPNTLYAYPDSSLEYLKNYTCVEYDGSTEAYDKILTAGHRAWIVCGGDEHDVTNGLKGFWIMVNAPACTQNDIISAIKAGHFYATLGPVITNLVTDGADITISVGQSSDIRWVGQNNQTLKTSSAVTTDTYTATGTEGYIRVEVIANGRIAFTQPIFVENNTLPTQTPLPLPIQDGLVLSYNFSQDVGDTIVDLSGNGLNGTNSGSTLIELDSGAKARDFDEQDYIYKTHDPLLDLTQYSIEIIFQPRVGTMSETSTGRYLVSKGTLYTPNYVFYYEGGNDHTVSGFYNQTDTFVSLNSYAESQDRLYHMIVSYDGTSMQTYIDGELDKFTYSEIGTPKPNTNSLYVGGGSSSRYFNGTIALVNIYNRPFNVTDARQQFLSRVPIINNLADFSASSTATTTVHGIKFMPVSTCEQNSYAWDFENDGVIDSTKRNPVHVYGKPGIYSVNLTVTNKYGTFNELKTDYVTVTSPAFASDPVAWFNWILSYITSMHVAFWGANY